MSRIGILAGGGRLPLTIAESLAARGEGVHIVAIEGEADPAVARFPHTWVNWGQIGRMVATLRGEGAEALVIAGTVRRPNLRHIRPDAGFFRSLPQIVAMLGGGDDSVLTRVVRFFERQGLRVSGVHEVVPELLAGAGSIARAPLADRERVDAEIGFAARRALAPVDTGQAVVVAEGRVLAIEGPEGTDAMLQRVAALGSGASRGLRRGVLAKGPKPGQERRVDLPAIGPRTVEQAAAAGLAAVVVEAGGLLVLDRAELIAAADAAGCAVHGLEAGAAIEATHPRAAPRVGRVIGRRRPGRRDAVDVIAGLTAVEALAPFAAGASAVVVRNFLLALEGAEGPSAVLERAARLRQWGLRWRKVGVFVRRAEAGGGDAGALAGLLSQAAAQELAGVAVTGTPDALAPYEEAARLADDLGLFLVLCEGGLA
jgi:DUF1009 family protein